MKRHITLKAWLALFCIVFIPHFLFAAAGKPLNKVKTDYGGYKQIISDTTFPVLDTKTTGNKNENAGNKNPVQVVKVIPKARRQPIPVPVKVNVHRIKIINPKIIKPVVKPVIKILH